MNFLVFFLALFMLFAPVSNAISISLGEKAPAFNLKSVEGKTVSLDDYKSRILVIIYWQSDHDRSLPALKDGNELLEKFEQKGIQIISVIPDSDNKDAARNILGENGISYPFFIDADRQFYSSYGIRVYPTTVIIDRDGIIVYDIPSHPLTYKPTLEGYIRNLLGEIDESQLKEVLSPHKEKKDSASPEASRLYNLAMKFTESRMLDMAIETAIKSVRADPEMVKSHILLGFLYLATQEADKALEVFNRTMEMDPGSHDAKTGYGGALILKGDIDRAIEILNSAAVANPYPQMTYYELGKAYELKGDKDMSVEMYKKAIEKIIKKQILPSSLSKCD